MNLLTDPKAINYLLIVIYLLNAGRWAYAKSYPDVLYWISAMCITISVTMFKR